MGCCGGCGGEDHQAKNEQDTQEQTTEQEESTNEA